MTLQPLPPLNIEAEEHVLGAMMISPAAIESVIEAGLTSRDFYRGSHGLIFDAIIALHVEGTGVDVLTVIDRLEGDGVLEDVGGKLRLREIATLVPPATNVRHHAGLVKRSAGQRRDLDLFKDAAAASRNGGLDHD